MSNYSRLSVQYDALLSDALYWKKISYLYFITIPIVVMSIFINWVLFFTLLLLHTIVITYVGTFQCLAQRRLYQFEKQNSINKNRLRTKILNWILG